MAGVEQVGDTTLLVAETPGANPNVMRGWIDQIRKQSDSETAIFFCVRSGGASDSRCGCQP